MEDYNEHKPLEEVLAECKESYYNYKRNTSTSYYEGEYILRWLEHSYRSLYEDYMKLKNKQNENNIY